MARTMSPEMKDAVDKNVDDIARACALTFAHLLSKWLDEGITLKQAQKRTEEMVADQAKRAVIIDYLTKRE